MSADRLKTVFDHSVNGVSDNYKRLAASVINGNVAPATGFGDHAIAERRPSYSLPATIATSAPTPAGSWLNWMIRNGEVERIAEGNRIALSPATPAFEPDAVHSPDGYFIGNYPPASPAVAPLQFRHSEAPRLRTAKVVSTAASEAGALLLQTLPDAINRKPRCLTRALLRSAISLRGSSRRLPIVETLLAVQPARFLRIRRAASPVGSPLWLASIPPSR